MEGDRRRHQQKGGGRGQRKNESVDRKKSNSLFWNDVCSRLVYRREVGSYESKRSNLNTEDSQVENEGSDEGVRRRTRRTVNGRPILAV